MKFVSLHSHTTFSNGDGFGLPKEHAARVADLEMGALGVTEHGSISSFVQHEKAAQKVGIKPIFGCELYTATGRNARKWHLTVLAMDQVGYRNLNKIVTRSYAEGFYRWPTVSGQMLKEHSDGLIVLSGCADSQLSCMLLGGKGVDPHPPDYAGAKRLALKYKEIFGDRYYLECQQFPELERTRTLNPAWEQLSAETGIPLVATADVHYPMPDDNQMQLTLHAASRGAASVAQQAEGWEYDIRLTYPTSDATVLSNLRATGLTGPAAEAAMASAGLIADRCTVTLPKMERLRFPLQPGETTKDLIWKWLREGWAYRWKRDAHMRAHRAEYGARLDYEMGMIESKDFMDYFLMLSELVRWCKDNPRPVPVGPARGSAAASLACWLLRITEVNPLLFPNMVFERFIDITRVDDPDVDLDFSDEQRPRVREHLVEVWGDGYVGNIGNFVKYRGKNAVDDVARVHNIPPFKAAIVKDLVIERSGGDSRFDASLEDTFTMFPQAGKVLAEFPALSQAVRLEGNHKGMSVHAAGLVVASQPISDITAMYQREIGKNKQQVSVLAYDKYDAEYLGMLKVDALGLSTMGMIDIALGLLDMKLDDLYQIPLDDPETLAAFKRGDVLGIFQFEGRATRLVNNDVSPDNFMELADINALSRPGPLFSGATAAYVDVKHGRKPAEHLHPIVDNITQASNFQIIYQEQILRIVREVGNFPWTHASAIRTIISKKKGEAAFNEMYGRFEAGAAENGIDPKLALRIWKSIVTSGTYAFNIAHCISYSMLGFWCMWLKVHHPVAFYTAQFQKTPADPKQNKLPRLMRDALEHGIDVRPPSLNGSGVTWTADFGSNAVRAGYSQIPGIGEKMAAGIIADREERGDFPDWAALTRVKGVGPKMSEKVQQFGTSDDPFQLKKTANELDELRAALGRGGALYGQLPRPTHRSDDIPTDADQLPVVWVGKVKAKNYQDFVENRRARTGEEVEDILRTMKDKHLQTSCVLQCYDDGHEEVYVRFNRWTFPRFKDVLEDLKTDHDMVVVRGIKRSGFGIAIHVDKFWALSPDEDDEEPTDD